MKLCNLNIHITFLIVLTMLLVVTSPALAAITVTGTKHDLSANPSIKGGLSACAYCHGAHNNTVTQIPLWGRTDDSNEYTLYASTTIRATVESPGTMTRVCLSCHDGTIAFDAVLGSIGTSGNDMNTLFPDSPAIIGRDLSDDHPVGVSVSTNSAGLRDAATITGAGLRLYAGKVECASCHDVHGSGGYASFLRLDPANSKLCQTCHIK